MRRTYRTLAVLVVIVAAGASMFLLVSSEAAAQDGGNDNETAAPTGEYIDTNTVLLDYEYDSEQGTVMVTLRSETYQDVEIYDAGGFWTEEDIATRTVELSPGEETTVRIAVTEQQGFVGVGIDTEETIHSVVIEEPNQDLSFVDRLASLEALGVGSISAFIWFVLSGIYVLYIEGGEPEVA